MNSAFPKREDQLFNEIVQQLSSSIPFVGPDELERIQGCAFLHRLGANESPWGISKKAMEAIVQALSNISLYPDPLSWNLRNSLSEIHHIELNQLLVGSGIDELLSMIAHVFIEPGKSVVTTANTYPTFNYFVEGRGGIVYKCNYTDELKVDYMELLKTAHEKKSSIIYIANPDNPTGSLLDSAELEYIYREMPANCILVLDEAYIDFVTENLTWQLSSVPERLLRLRSFSKSHGLAGMRIGYVISTEQIIRGLCKIRSQYGVNRLAQAAALASIHDVEFQSEVIASNERVLDSYLQLFVDCGFKTNRSFTNFVLVQIRDVEIGLSLYDELMKERIFVRPIRMSEKLYCLRVSAGYPCDFEMLRQGFMKASKSIKV